MPGRFSFNVFDWSPRLATAVMSGSIGQIFHTWTYNNLFVRELPLQDSPGKVYGRGENSVGRNVYFATKKLKNKKDFLWTSWSVFPSPVCEQVSPWMSTNARSQKRDRGCRLMLHASKCWSRPCHGTERLLAWIIQELCRSRKRNSCLARSWGKLMRKNFWSLLSLCVYFVFFFFFDRGKEK